LNCCFSRSCAIDPVHDERPPLPARPEVRFDLIVDRQCLGAPLQRHGEQTRRLVHHDQRLVLVDDVQVADLRAGCRRPGTARPIHPDAHEIADGQPASGIRRSDFDAVEKYLASLERGEGAAARGEAIGRREKLVETKRRVCSGDAPVVARRRGVGLTARHTRS
jgi:hypothetical protein